MHRATLTHFLLCEKDSTNTVRLLTHVLCKPTHFFFHSFIATKSYYLQTSFISVMEDWALISGSI